MGIFSKKTSLSKRRISNNIDSSRMSSSSVFRRNSNLGGYRVDNRSNSPRAKIHHLSIKRRKLFSIFLMIIFLILVLYLLINNFTATVSINYKNKNYISKINSQIYQEKIQNYLRLSPLGRFHFLLNESDLTDFVSSDLTEVEHVVQKTTIGLGVTEFEIILREPVASWKIDNKLYYVDKNGIAFESNYFNEPVVRVVDKSGAYIESGQASISKRFLGFVGQVVSLSNENSYVISQAILPVNTTRQLDIVLKEPNLTVKMTIDRSALEQVSDMGRAVDYFTTIGELPEYIDVRVDNHVFYK